MRALRFGIALVVAALLQFTGLQVVSWFSLAFDFFLVILVFNALDGDTLAGMLGGMVAGWTADALTGGPFGLFGLANTVVGYVVAATGQRLVIQRASSSLFVFSLAAAAQQAMVLGMSLVLMPSPEAPDLRWLLVKVVTTGVLGLGLYLGSTRLRSKMEIWRRARTSKVRFGR